MYTYIHTFIYTLLYPTDTLYMPCILFPTIRLVTVQPHFLNIFYIVCKRPAAI